MMQEYIDCQQSTSPCGSAKRKQLSSQIEARWNIKTLVPRSTFRPEFANCIGGTRNQRSSGSILRWWFLNVTLDKIDRTALNTNERATIQSILDGGDAGHGPFSRLGWIEEAKAWIKRSIGDEGLRFTEDMRHLNGGGKFCLIRLMASTGNAYWLKSCRRSQCSRVRHNDFSCQELPSVSASDNSYSQRLERLGDGGGWLILAQFNITG